MDAYFDLIVRLAADHPRLIQRTLEVATDLLNAFALQAGSISAEQLGHVQKLLGFLGAVLTSAAATSAAQQQGGAPAAQEALFRPGRAGHFERRDRSVSRNRAPQVHEAIVESREEGRDEAVREDSEDEEEEDLISFGEEDEEEEVRACSACWKRIVGSLLCSLKGVVGAQSHGKMLGGFLLLDASLFDSQDSTGTTCRA